jgi:hypothetical protein
LKRLYNELTSADIGLQHAVVAGYIALSYQLATKSNVCNQAQTSNPPGNFGKPLLGAGELIKISLFTFI